MTAAGQQILDAIQSENRSPGLRGVLPRDPPQPAQSWQTRAEYPAAQPASLGSPHVERSRAEHFRPEPARHPRRHIARAVELDVLPRLVLARRGAAELPPVEANCADLSACASVEEFAALVLGPDVPLAFAYADRFRARGVSLEDLYLRLLAPAARYLGDLWTEDLVGFTSVTIALGRMHRLLREFSPLFADVPVFAGSPSFASGPAPARPDQRALLVAAPGEQHTFGLAMVTEFFRRAAWSVWSGAPTSRADLVGIVRNNWFDIAGFSLGSELRLDALRAAIRGVRQASRNPRLGIMVGGPVFIEHPEWVAQVGADAMAADGRQAVMQAHSLAALLMEV